MKTFKQRLLDMLGLKSKEEFAEELNILLDDYKSSIAVRLEREYTFTEHETGEFVASDCFITPPQKGEWYVTSKGIYEILQVTHVLHSSSEAGTIHVKKQRNFKSAG